jgi:uncharacterized protein
VTSPGARPLAVKLALLRRLLNEHQRLVVAFSGGKDSFFLWLTASQALGSANVLPFFVSTPFTLGGTRERLEYFRDNFSVPLREIHVDLFQDARMRRNPRQRCFFCKKAIFSALKREGHKLGIRAIADGSTASDLEEHRPGRAALEKLSILSPLRDAGFTAAEISRLLKKRGVAEYFLTSSTCLATRFPYDFPLDPRLIGSIGRIEQHLVGSGIFPVRVRYMDGGVRIETPQANFRKLIAVREPLIARCREAGLHLIAMDLAGMKSGSWDDLERTRSAETRGTD